MNKFSFISKDGQKTLVNLEFIDNIPNLTLNIDNPILITDGYNVCSCGIIKEERTKGSQEEISDGNIGCKTCLSTVKWDLEDKFKEQEKIKNQFEDLKNFLGLDDDDCKKSDFAIYNKLDETFKLFTQHQKKQITNWLVKKTVYLNLKLKSEIKEVQKLKKDFEVLKDETVKNINKKIDDLSNKVNNPTETYLNDFKNCLEEEVKEKKKVIDLDIENSITTKLKEIINLEKSDFSNVIDKNYDVMKIKRTLNIIMELITKGMDFKAILLKAKSDLNLNMNSNQINLNNCELQYSNENTYMNDNVQESVNNLFTRFYDV